MHNLVILRDLTVVFAAAVLVVLLLRRIGIPPIAGFIIAGVLVGPQGFGLIGDAAEVAFLAEVGIALLLFGIGLELSLNRLQRLWRQVLVGGALQVGITIAAVLLCAPLLGVSYAQAFLLGSIIAVSSTAIVLRGLQTRDELDAPHGRLVLGILVFQDLCVVPMMLAISLLSGPSSSGKGLWSITATVLALVLVLTAARWIVPRLLHAVARTRQRDLFLLTALLICIGTAWMTTLAGVSLALGAFLAGLIVAGSEYRHQAMADLIPFREVLTSLFFVSIGMLLDPRLVIRHLDVILLLLVLVLIGKCLIVMAVTRIMGLPLRVSVLAGMALAQVGEFSFVLYLAAQGTSLLAFSFRESLLAAIILSMILTPFLLDQAPRVADAAVRSRLLGRIFRGASEPETYCPLKTPSDHVIIAGWGVAGQELGAALKGCGVPYVVADLNPQAVHAASQEGEPIVYGDVTAEDALERLGIRSARMFVLVVSDPHAAESAIRTARRVAPAVPILVRTRYLADVDDLMAAGATDVVPAEIEAAVEVTSRVLMACGAKLHDVSDERTRIRRRREDDGVKTGTQDAHS